MNEEIRKALLAMTDINASDLHVTANSTLHYRIDNDLVPVNDKVLSGDDARRMAYSLMSDSQIKRFEEEKELDFSMEIEGVARFRCNAFYQRQQVGCAIRMIPYEIRSIEECGLPGDIVKKFCKNHKGMVLVTGATGSGKSTTLAAMVDEINKNRKCHIVTIEDPIEFVHKGKKALIDQRQLYEDTHSFAEALRHVLRQDPDVILVGELRDLDTVQAAMVCADTGHLVLGTLHTSDSVQTINRIIDIFPSHQQRQVRTQLSFVLKGIVSQQLINKAEGVGRVLATEIMVTTPAVSSQIREGKEHQIYSIIQTSQKHGMRTMNQVLSGMYNEGIISLEDAMSRSSDVEELKKLIG